MADAIINIDDLRTNGYKVEDMGAEYGKSFAGRWRWINIRNGQFQDDHHESHNEHDAWQQADRHCRAQKCAAVEVG
jgi:hypothetical protein